MTTRAGGSTHQQDGSMRHSALAGWGPRDQISVLFQLARAGDCCPIDRSPCEVTDEDKEATVVQELCRTQADGRPARNQRLDQVGTTSVQFHHHLSTSPQPPVKVLDADQPRVSVEAGSSAVSMFSHASKRGLKS